MPKKAKPIDEVEDDYIRIPIPKEFAKLIDNLIGRGYFKSRAEVVREALRYYFELHKSIEKHKEELISDISKQFKKCIEELGEEPPINVLIDYAKGDIKAIEDWIKYRKLEKEQEKWITTDKGEL